MALETAVSMSETSWICPQPCSSFSKSAGALHGPMSDLSTDIGCYYCVPQKASKELFLILNPIFNPTVYLTITLYGSLNYIYSPHGTETNVRPQL